MTLLNEYFAFEKAFDYTLALQFIQSTTFTLLASLYIASVVFDVRDGIVYAELMRTFYYSHGSKQQHFHLTNERIILRMGMRMQWQKRIQ